MYASKATSSRIVDDQARPIGIVTDRGIAMSAMLNHKPL
jgi:hypothetical protein